MKSLVSKIRDFFQTQRLEELVRAKLSDSEFLVTFSDGRVERMPKEQIQEIAVQTTTAGPFLEDVYWAISNAEFTLYVPQASPDFPKLLDQFGRFPGFDRRPFSEAMTCTDDKLFVCWRRNTEQLASENYSGGTPS